MFWRLPLFDRGLFGPPSIHLGLVSSDMQSLTSDPFLDVNDVGIHVHQLPLRWVPIQI